MPYSQTTYQSYNYTYSPSGKSGATVERNSDDSCLSHPNGLESRRRNFSTWTYDSIPPRILPFDRGYTGHEHLDFFGLINMNGRVYDPILGRMLSPDNDACPERGTSRRVQNTSSTQNFNRYSYVLNNPLKYTNPSGEIIGLVIAGAVIGAYLGGAIAEEEWSPDKWAWDKNTWKGVVTGAVVGLSLIHI